MIVGHKAAPSEQQRKRAQILAKELWGDNRAERLTHWSDWVGRIITFNDLTESEAASVISTMANKRKAGTGAAHQSTRGEPASPANGAEVDESTRLAGATHPYDATVARNKS